MVYQSNEVPADHGEPLPQPPFCIFCYKEVRKDLSSAHAHPPQNKNNNKLGSLARFLGLKVISSSVISSCAADSRFKFCSDCEPLLDKVADLYGNLRRIELELEWKIGMIKDIMVAADRVIPSRVAVVKGHYSETGKESIVGQVEEWRRKLVRKCALKLKGSFPKVKLHKLEDAESVVGVTSSSRLMCRRRTRTPPKKPMMFRAKSYATTNKQIIKKSPPESAEPIIIEEKLEIDESAAECHLKKEMAVLLVASPIPAGRTTGYVTEGLEEEIANSHDDDDDDDIRSTAADDWEDEELQVMEGPLMDQGDTASALDYSAKKEQDSSPGQNHLLGTSRLLRAQFRCRKCNKSFSSKSRFDSHCQAVHLHHHHQLENRDNYFDWEGEKEREPEGSSSSGTGSEYENDDASGVNSDEPSSPEPPNNNNSRRKVAIRREGEPAPLLKLNDDNESQEDTAEFPRRKKFPCSTCQLPFSTSSALNAHVKSHHGDSSNMDKSQEDVFNCEQDQCSAYFLHPNQLERHRKLFHHEEGPAKLATEGRRRRRRGRPLSSSEQLEYKYNCSVCNARFTERHNLKAHFKSHHDVRKSEEEERVLIKCEQVGCSAYFLAPSQLQRHLQTTHKRNSTKEGAEAGRTSGNVTEGLGEEIDKHEDDDEEHQVMGDSLMEVTTEFPQNNPIKNELTDDVVKKCERMVVRDTNNKGKRNGFQRRKSCQRQTMRVQQHQCRVCRSSCPHSSSLRRHYREQHGVRVKDAVRCGVGGCSAYFITQNQLHRHQATTTTTHLTSYKEKDLELKSPSSNKVARRKRRFESEEAVKKRHKSNGHTPPPESHKLNRKSEPQNTGRRSPPEENRKRCKTCGKEFTTVSHLRRHRYTVHKEEVDLKFTCEVAGCGRKFESEGEAKYHVSLWHPVGKLQPRIKSHEVIRRGGLPVCELCGMSCRDWSHLKDHLKTHYGPSSWDFQCSMCSKKCKSKYLLERHMSTHTGQDSVICQYCGMVLSTKDTLKIHTAKKHRYQVEGKREPEPGDLKFPCEVAGCGRTFESAGGLHRHNGWVHKGGNHICEVCGKSISSKAYLKQHLKRHSGQLLRRPDNKFECSTCGYKCPSNQRLVRHMRTHTGERPFSCQYCGDRFTREDSLKGHKAKRHPDI